MQRPVNLATHGGYYSKNLCECPWRMTRGFRAYIARTEARWCEFVHEKEAVPREWKLPAA